MLVSVFKDDYCWPPGFAIDENSSFDDPFVVDKTLKTYNAEEKATDLVNYI